MEKNADVKTANENAEMTAGNEPEKVEMTKEEFEKQQAWLRWAKQKYESQKESQLRQKRKRILYELCYEKLIAEGIPLPTKQDVTARLERIEREKEWRKEFTI